MGLIKILANLFELKEDEIGDSLAMHDVDIWDSLKHMELIISIENVMGAELTFGEIVAMQSVGEIKRVLEARGIEWS